MKRLKHITAETTRTIVIFLLAAFTFPSLFGQSSAKKDLADQNYGYLNFSVAAPMYGELAKKNERRNKKGKATDWEVIRRAGESYFYTRNYKESARWYGFLAEKGAASKEDLFMYFESLRYLGRYEESAKYLDMLKGLNVEDKVIQSYVVQSNYYRKLKADSSNYKLKKLSLNKNLGDFGPAFYQEGIAYASSRKGSTLGGKYGWDNTGFLNVYYSQKEGDDFSKRGKLQKRGFKTKPHDGPVFFSKDFKTAYITRNRTEKDRTAGKDDKVMLNLYIAEKGQDNKWGVPQPFQYNSNTYSIGHAALSSDEKTLYFASDMPGGEGGVDIWKSEKVAGGWGVPVNLGKVVNTPSDEMFPFVDKDNTLYFASKGHVGLGGLDIFESRNAGGNFITPFNLGYPVNTQFDDFALITQDGKLAYMSSDRSDYIDRIYSVMMNRIILNLEGTVKNNGDKTTIENADVVVKNLTIGDSMMVKTDSSGKFYVPLNTECDYVITAGAENYKLEKPEDVTTKGVKESKTLTAELFLNPGGEKRKKGDGLFVLRVLDCYDKKPLANMTFTLKGLEDDFEKTVTTNANGEIEIFQPGNEIPTAKGFALIHSDLENAMVGQSYLPSVKRVYYVIKGSEPDLKITKEVCLEKMEEGSSFVLEDIYYDFDKATLRPKSIVDLDKAYRFLMMNPTVRIELSSHTDSRGTDSYNMALSQRRAQSCVDYLVKVKGIPSSRLVAKGYGETKHVNNCSNGVPCSEEEHQQNRRTEVRILKSN